jgi:hypothetical protein
LHIPLDQIDEGRLQALIDAGAAESRIINYKRTTYGNAHSDYSELLADTSSFANTAGGDLILGMDAVNGIPTAFMPFAGPNRPGDFAIIPADLAECAGMLRPMLDQVANTGGRAKSPIFDVQGRYLPVGG